jgi:hypothetical protein
MPPPTGLCCVPGVGLTMSRLLGVFLDNWPMPPPTGLCCVPGVGLTLSRLSRVSSLSSLPLSSTTGTAPATTTRLQAFLARHSVPGVLAELKENLPKTGRKGSRGLWIRRYFFRIHGSMILNYGSGSGRPVNYGIRTQPKNLLWTLKKICCQIGTLHWIRIHRAERDMPKRNSRRQYQ